MYKVMAIDAACTLGRFILHRTHLFQVFGANPVPWDVIKIAMPFFSHKCFLVRAQELKFWKYFGKQKKQSNFHIRGLNGSS